MKDNPLQRYLLLVVVLVSGLTSSLPSQASVLETKSLTRDREAVVLKGTNLTSFYTLQVNSADVTLSPNQIFVWAYDSATGWRQVVFQIDEVNNTYPTRPGPDYYICDTTTWHSRGGSGTNYYEADDGLWDSNDELVFMTSELGDRVSLDEWAPGAVTTAVRYEIAITDPLDTAKKGWAYIFRHDTLPAWTTTSYMTWTESSNSLSARDYTLTYPTTDGFAMNITSLAVTPALGGTGASLFAQRWRSNFYFTYNSSNRSETQMRTQFPLGCYTSSNNTEGDSPWLYKAGRVRVSRYYWTNPTEGSLYTGDHPWKPMHNNQYFATFFHEDQYMNHSCPTCAAEMNWYRDYLDHTNTLTFNFYDSNGDSCLINGTAETLATTPMWTWSQSSSSAGSFVKLYPLTYMPLDSGSPTNYYLDTGTIEGEAGYYLNEPQHTSSTHHHFYYFVLPPNAANVGALYRSYLDNPLTTGTASQSYVASPPLNFAGITGAVDLNGACADEGVQITWDNALDWNDGCTSPCPNRRFEIYRNAALIYTVTDVALSSWTDTTGSNGVSYSYKVEACNNGNACTAVGTSLPAMDFVSTSPALSSSSVAATDISGCLGSGVQITWTAPSSWNDNGTGSRRFDLYWDADAYAAPIASDIASPYTYDAPDGVSRSYRVRAVNGCSLYTNYSNSPAVTDQVGVPPTLPANPALGATDKESCSLSGITLSWDPVSDWGDNGFGSRSYNIYWSADSYATPIFAGATSPVDYSPGDPAGYTYRLIATNGCGQAINYTDVSMADGVTAASFTGVSSVTDALLCTASALTISWPAVVGDGPEGWNDGGAGPQARVFRIYREGAEIANSPQVETATGTTDQPPATNAPYTYSVRAYNKNACWTDGGAIFAGTDYAAVAPTATPGQTGAEDIDCAAGNGVTVNWDSVTDWGDNGNSPANRRYRVYWSADNFASPIGSLLDGVTSFNYNPADNLPFKYRVVPRNGCNLTKIYLDSLQVIDKTSCSPPCEMSLDNDFDPTNGLVQTCNGGKNLWALTAGVGNGGTQAWLCNLGDGANINSSSAIEMSAAVNLIWTQDVKVRFWSSCSLAADDAGIVELWTNDTATWRKVEGLALYPNPSALVPDSISANCPTDAFGGYQPGFQGTVTGFFYEARLDSYLTAGTTQIKVRFKAASGGSAEASTWVIDDVQIGYGITDRVYFWSFEGDPAKGVVRDAGGTQAILSWEDDSLYSVANWRIYRSTNPANIRTDATSLLIHSETDTGALSYSFTTIDGAPAESVCWCYKIYGYKEPCGESNQGEN